MTTLVTFVTSRPGRESLFDHLARSPGRARAGWPPVTYLFFGRPAGLGRDIFSFWASGGMASRDIFFLGPAGGAGPWHNSYLGRQKINTSRRNENHMSRDALHITIDLLDALAFLAHHRSCALLHNHSHSSWVFNILGEAQILCISSYSFTFIYIH